MFSKYIFSKYYKKNLFDDNQTPVSAPKQDIFDLVHTGKLRVLSSEIEKGISVNTANSKGQTLLHYALIYHQIGIAKFLISKGANIDIADNSGKKVRDLVSDNQEIQAYFDECNSLHQQEDVRPDVEASGSSSNYDFCNIC
jgi:ankyrin repeat protein